MPKTNATKSNERQFAELKVPLGKMPNDDSYETEKINRGIVTVEAKLGKEAAVAFVQVRNGLRESNAKLISGRPVWTNADALRWLMEQLNA